MTDSEYQWAFRIKERIKQLKEMQKELQDVAKIVKSEFNMDATTRLAHMLFKLADSDTGKKIIDDLVFCKFDEYEKQIKQLEEDFKEL